MVTIWAEAGGVPWAVRAPFWTGAAKEPPADRTRNIKRIKEESFISEPKT